MINKLAKAAKVSEDAAKRWLAKQAHWQIFFPTLWCIPRLKFNVPTPNAVHQADLLFMPHDEVERKGYYAFTTR